jgi:hypothetical protein
VNDLPQADRFCDHPSDNPYWNESAWFSFSLPQRRLHGAIQYYFRPNMRMLNGGPMLWDPSGTFSWNCLYYNWSHLQALPPGAQKFDMTANNSLSVKVLEPLARYAIRYDLEDFVLDLQWQAIGPMHELRSADPGQKATAKFHMEQPGRMTGSMRRDGEHYTIDCFSMRDTSYGPRDYASTASGGYFWGIAKDSAFHAITKGEGAVQNLIGGFLWREGQMASLATGTRRVLEFGRYGPRRVAFDAIDTLGRSVSALGSIDDGLIFTGYTDHTVVWSLCEWDVGGVTHWGDNQEFCPALRFRRIARGDIALG